jgi:hypothetical protein
VQFLSADRVETFAKPIPIQVAGVLPQLHPSIKLMVEDKMAYAALHNID